MGSSYVKHCDKSDTNQHNPWKSMFLVLSCPKLSLHERGRFIAEELFWFFVIHSCSRPCVCTHTTAHVRTLPHMLHAPISKGEWLRPLVKFSITRLQEGSAITHTSESKSLCGGDYRNPSVYKECCRETWHMVSYLTKVRHKNKSQSLTESPAQWVLELGLP